MVGNWLGTEKSEILKGVKDGRESGEVTEEDRLTA
jgi:hypothetical protein